MGQIDPIQKKLKFQIWLNIKVHTRGSLHILSYGFQLDNYMLKLFHICLFISPPFNCHMQKLNVVVHSSKTNTYLNISIGDITLNKRLILSKSLLKSIWFHEIFGGINMQIFNGFNMWRLNSCSRINESGNEFYGKFICLIVILLWYCGIQGINENI
jgi:hypothetical protein